MTKRKRRSGTFIRLKPLTRAEGARTWLDGFTGIAESLSLDRIRTHSLEADTTEETGIENGRGPARERAARLTAELRTLDVRHSDIVERSKVVVRDRVAVSRTASEISAARPARFMPLVWTTIAVVLLLGDAALNWLTFGDVFGWDITNGLGASLLLFLLVCGVTLLVTVVTAVTGMQTADQRSPSRRMLGWILLLTIAAALAGLRASTTGETSAMLAVFAFIVTAIAGWASGRAHTELKPYLAEVAEHRERLMVVNRKLVDADKERAVLDAETRKIESRSEEIHREMETIRSAPERSRRERAEFRQIVEARLSAARALYRQGARFAGRGGEDHAR